MGSGKWRSTRRRTQSCNMAKEQVGALGEQPPSLLVAKRPCVRGASRSTCQSPKADGAAIPNVLLTVEARQLELTQLSQCG